MEQAIENDFNLDPAKVIKIIRRRAKPLIITMVVFFVLATVIILLWPKTYKSTATILIEQQEIPQDLVRSTVTSYADQRIQIIMQRAMTFSNLSQIIKKFTLYSDIYRREPMEKIVEMMKDDIHHKMINADVVDPLSGRPVEATLAFSIGYENESPKLAQQVANELSNLFIDENLRTRRDMADQTADFLLAESQLLEKSIEDIEASIAKFKEANIESLPELVDLNMKLMDRTEQDLLETDRQIRVLKERRIYADSELAKTLPYSPLYASTGERVMSPEGRLKVLESRYISMASTYAPTHPDMIRTEKEIESLRLSLMANNKNGKSIIADINKKIFALEGKKYQLLETYSEKHPDIVSINKELNALYKEQSAKEINFTKNFPEKYSRIKADADNPVYIQLLAQLNAIETELNSEERRKQKLDAKLNEYERRLVGSPQIEKEYSELLRNYKHSTLKYQEISAKLMEANISRSMERESKGERFVLIEPAMIPQVPIKPNRVLLLILAAFFSSVAGAGLVWLMEKMDKSIRSRDLLMQLSGVAPLVEIPFISTDVDLQQKKILMQKYLITAFVVLILSMVLINTLYKPLDILWFVIWRKLGIM